MSMPYFVHKDDADAYDAREKELRPIIERAKEAVSKLDRKISHKQYYKERSAVEDSFSPEQDLINTKYGEIRIKSVFDKVDDREYVVYFRGRRLDKKFGDAMVGTAEDGIDAILKVLKGE